MGVVAEGRMAVPGSEKIPTNLRLLRVLEVLSDADGPMTPTAIGRALDMPKPTVHRLCKTLLEERYLVQDGTSNRLRPARRTRSMAAGVMFNSWQHTARHQVLVDVARQVGETVNFVVPEDQGMFYVDRVETDWLFQVNLPIGSHVPFHCTASGKTYLASLPGAERRRMVESLTLTQQTPNTIATVDGLLEELKAIRRNGYAIDNEELFEGMVAIAVPVRDDRDRYIASLAFHGPVPRLSTAMALAQKNVLTGAAEALSRIFFESEMADG